MLLVSGKKSDVLVSAKDSIQAVRQSAFASWPKEWRDAGDNPEKPDNLRFVWGGKFLHVESTVEGMYLELPWPGFENSRFSGTV